MAITSRHIPAKLRSWSGVCLTFIHWLSPAGREAPGQTAATAEDIKRPLILSTFARPRESPQLGVFLWIPATSCAPVYCGTATLGAPDQSCQIEFGAGTAQKSDVQNSPLASADY